MNIKKTISEKPWILAFFVFFLVVSWMVSGLNNERKLITDTSQIQSQDTSVEKIKVQVTKLEAKKITRFVNVNGRTSPFRTTTVSAEAEGKIISINANRGEKVDKGTSLISLDLRDRQARLEQAKASVKEHKTAFEAQTKLKVDGYVSDTDITETIAKLESAKAELVRAELDLKNQYIRAPFDGLLEEREVEIGDFVRAGDPVATFVDISKLKVSGTLAEKEIKDITVGEDALAKLVTGQEVGGVISYLSPVADEATRTFSVEIEILNKDGSLPAGVTAEMQLKGGEALAHKLSPAILILDSDGNLGVYIVDDSKRAIFVPIQIERSETNGVWVSGLPNTADVITLGQGYINNGQTIEPDYQKVGSMENT
ncbi:MAG: efflux RND transporter periplasmic adaptor subunit [Pseudomonadota bacterium]|nr:efflux RND transporter periplasmic adaptor subunit [Pseudomonadota bacterium]